MKTSFPATGGSSTAALSRSSAQIFQRLLALTEFNVTVRAFDAAQGLATLATPAGPVQAKAPLTLVPGHQYPVQAQAQDGQLILKIQIPDSALTQLKLPLQQIPGLASRLQQQPWLSAQLLAVKATDLRLHIGAQTIRVPLPANTQSPWPIGQKLLLRADANQVVLQPLPQQAWTRAIVQQHLPQLLKVINLSVETPTPKPATEAASASTPTAVSQRANAGSKSAPLQALETHSAETSIARPKQAPSQAPLNSTSKSTESAARLIDNSTATQKPASGASETRAWQQQIQQQLPQWSRLDAAMLKSWIALPPLNSLNSAPKSPVATAAASQADSPIMMLIRLLGGLKQLTEATPQPRQPSAKADAPPEPPPALQQLGRQLEQQLVKTLVQQASQTLHNEPQQPLQLQLAIPLQLEQQTRELKLKLREHRNPEADSISSQWEIQLQFELPVLGLIQSRLLLQDRHISTWFWSELSSTRALLQQHQQDLRERLGLLGYQMPVMEVLPGAAPQGGTELDWYVNEAKGLLDLQV